MKSYQVEKNDHYRDILLISFCKCCKAAKAAQDICTVYGDGAITERTAQKWFSRFGVGILISVRWSAPVALCCLMKNIWTSFFGRIVTGDGKWCMYINMKRLSPKKMDSTNKTRSAPAQVCDIRLVGLERRYPLWIEKVVERWEEVINNDGNYIIDWLVC